MVRLNLPQMTGTQIAHYPYFPTKQQLFIWRNWEMVTVQKIADILDTTADKVNELAAGMGLPVPADYNPEYCKRGFITIIRNNWHVLPYSQLLKLLDMTEDELAYTLKEDDFLYVKLSDKPDVPPVKYTPLTDEQRKETAKLKFYIQKHFTKYNGKITAKEFDFYSDFRNTAEQKKNITFRIQPDDTKKAESHEIVIGKDGIEICAVDEAGLMRGLNDLSDKELCEGKIVRDTRFEVRMIYSYSALYGDALIDGGLASYPDALLKEYSRIGINAVWVHCVLYKLIEFPWAPALSAGWEQRQKGLQDFTERAAQFGIKVYLYMNEPRSMPLSFFQKHPELLGYAEGDEGTLCTSLPQVQAYLSDAVTQLCSAAPGLGGFLTITASENLTNCYSHPLITTCPRCSKRKPHEVFAEINLLIARAAHRVNPDIRVIAWNWSWNGRIESIDAIAKELAGSGVSVMCTSEEGVTKNIGGIDISVIDYSISLVGPGKLAKQTWQAAKAQGLKTIAKVQFNNTWECATVPYLPVLDLVKQHMVGLIENEVDGLMIGWTLGGYPSVNLEIMSQYYWTNGDPEGIFDHIYGEDAGTARRAVSVFSKAFQNFPFHIGTLYSGPQHMGPANPLFEHDSHLRATMTGYPYDDIEQWRSVYPLEIFENQLRLTAEGFKEGLDLLSGKQLSGLTDNAAAAYCMFQSAYQQTAYNRIRNAYDAQTDDTQRAVLREIILELLNQEIEVAEMLYSIVIRNAAIGYEAANHYFFNKFSLMEKIICCEYLKTKFTY